MDESVLVGISLGGTGFERFKSYAMLTPYRLTATGASKDCSPTIFRVKQPYKNDLFVYVLNVLFFVRILLVGLTGCMASELGERSE